MYSRTAYSRVSIPVLKYIPGEEMNDANPGILLYDLEVHPNRNLESKEGGYLLISD